MFEKYRSEVINLYNEKKDAGLLSPNLVNYTAAKIRNEARYLFGMGCDETDRRMLHDFFGLQHGKTISDVFLKKSDADKFKPLCNYLNKGIKSHERNIELLAWLIDFAPRPFSNYWRTSKGRQELSVLSISGNGIVDQRGNPSRLPGEKSQKLTVDEMPHDYRRYQTGRPDNDIMLAEAVTKETCVSNTLTLEYPSGVKLSVDATNLDLIAQLVRL